MEAYDRRAAIKRVERLFSTTILPAHQLMFIFWQVNRKRDASTVYGCLKQENNFCDRQHRFARCRPTVINALICDKIIVDATLAGHHYDIISFDFKAAFDKASHRFVIEVLCCGNHWDTAMLVCLFADRQNTANAGRKQFFCNSSCCLWCHKMFSSWARALLCTSRYAVMISQNLSLTSKNSAAQRFWPV